MQPLRKTFVILLLLSIFPLMAAARIWLGGELSMKASSTSLGSFNLEKNNSIEVAPEVGFYTSGPWAFALRLGYAHYDDAVVKVVDQTTTGQYNQLRVNPFVRYVVGKTGIFSFFVDGGAQYNALWKSSYDGPMNTVGVDIRPGILIAIGDKGGLVAHVGAIAYDYSWVKDRGTRLTNHSVGMNLTGNFSFGGYVNF